MLAREFPSRGQAVDEAGLYSWWVDKSGADDLSRGLGLTVEPGLVYAGQTGASVGVGTSAATLRSRIGGNHLRGTVRGSTFRWTLAAALEAIIPLEGVGPRRLDPASERLLSKWMNAHLSVALVVVPDRVALDAVETAVLAELDPPFNLAKMGWSSLRTQLSARRSALGRDVRDMPRARIPRPPTVVIAHASVSLPSGSVAGLTPNELAADLGLPDGKQVRAYLRNTFPRRPEDHGSRWNQLSPEQEAAVRRQFGR